MPASSKDSKGKGVAPTSSEREERPEMPARTQSGNVVPELDEHPLPDEHKAKIVEK